jgi:hypothetical protein
VSRAADADADSEKLSADERARERLSQPKTGANRPQARAGTRPSGKVDPRKRRRQGRSTSATAGIFGGAFVVLAVIVIILISTLGGSSAGAAGAPIPYQQAPAAIVKAVTNVPPSKLTEAGLGGNAVGASGVFVPTPKQSLLIEDKKPVLVYEGSEYCPFCAASRWPLVIALSRFGTFTGLGIIASSPDDVYANTRTFSFAKATYASKYLVFDATELTSNKCAVALNSSSECPNADYTTVKAASQRDAKLFATYDVPPYFPSPGGGIPFIDWGGIRVSSGSAYSPNVITLGTEGTLPWKGWSPLSWTQIIATFTTPTSGPGQAVLGTANLYTAGICDMTHNQPASVCNTAVIHAGETELAKT